MGFLFKNIPVFFIKIELDLSHIGDFILLLQ